MLNRFPKDLSFIISDLYITFIAFIIYLFLYRYIYIKGLKINNLIDFKTGF